MVRLLLPLLLSGLVLPAGPAFAQESDADGEATIVARINAMRNVRGLPPLERHQGLDEAARVQSMDMATHGTLSHVSPRTADPPARVDAAGVPVERLAENIARGADVLGAHRSIISSEAHRRQLLDPEMTHLGISVVRADGAVWVTQVLARLGEEAGASEAAAGETAPPWNGAAGVQAAPEEPPRPGSSGGEPESAPAAPAPPPDAGGGFAPEPTAPSPSSPLVASAPAAASAQVVRVPASTAGRPIVGYWVAHNGRWLYYPVPEDLKPGQRITYDPRVQGPAVDPRYPEGSRYPVYRGVYRYAPYSEGYRQADTPCQTWQCQYYRQRGR